MRALSSSFTQLAKDVGKIVGSGDKDTLEE